MKTLDPKNISTKELHGLLLGGIGPRPIALASTMDKEGNPNLSPFSFFNIFSANPPILIFSPARRVRDNTIKHTLENVMEHPEVVVNIVNHSIVEQMSLSSTEYGKGVNEFSKSGLTPVESETIRPFRVQESPMQLECKVLEVKQLGNEGGAGNLVICEVIKVHFDENILDEDGKVSPFKIDLVGRMGGDWYVRANDDALFEVEKPLSTIGIGFDQLPEGIKTSNYLTGNELAKLANFESIPNLTEVEKWMKEEEIIALLNQKEDKTNAIHDKAKELLADNYVLEAWLTLLIEQTNRK
ncbi:MAG: flavin reductase family protein [Flavobacteriales bacterium]